MRRGDEGDRKGKNGKNVNGRNTLLAVFSFWSPFPFAAFCVFSLFGPPVACKFSLFGSRCFRARQVSLFGPLSLPLPALPAMFLCAVPFISILLPILFGPLFQRPFCCPFSRAIGADFQTQRSFPRSFVSRFPCPFPPFVNFAGLRCFASSRKCLMLCAARAMAGLLLLPQSRSVFVRGAKRRAYRPRPI